MLGFYFLLLFKLKFILFFLYVLGVLGIWPVQALYVRTLFNFIFKCMFSVCVSVGQTNCSSSLFMKCLNHLSLWDLSEFSGFWAHFSVISLCHNLIYVVIFQYTCFCRIECCSTNFIYVMSGFTLFTGWIHFISSPVVSFLPFFQYNMVHHLYVSTFVLYILLHLYYASLSRSCDTIFRIWHTVFYSPHFS